MIDVVRTEPAHLLVQEVANAGQQREGFKHICLEILRYLYKSTEHAPTTLYHSANTPVA
jgi:hypothetical protein